jgi:hypothetical protein
MHKDSFWKLVGDKIFIETHPKIGGDIWYPIWTQFMDVVREQVERAWIENEMRDEDD